MLWRLHLRPAPKNGKNHDDVMNYCINNHIAGIGWPVPTIVNNPIQYEQAARAEYRSRVASIPFANDPIPGEYIWARDRKGKYYLGRIIGNWFYSNDPLHLELDIPNQRKCEWIEIGNEEFVPGKIVACFRPAKTFQGIHDEIMEDFSKWTFSHGVDSNFSEIGPTKGVFSKTTFLNLSVLMTVKILSGFICKKLKDIVLSQALVNKQRLAMNLF